jgi:hypothetical protein
VGEFVLGCGGDGQVEASAEEAALTAREPACELVRVFGGGGDAEVGEAAAFQFEPAGGLEAGALFLLPLCGELGRDWLDVHRDIEVG